MASLQAKCYDYHRQGWTFTQIAAELQLDSRDVVAGHVYRAKQKRLETIDQTKLRIPQAKRVDRPENNDTDIARWEIMRDKLLDNNDYVRVMHMNDLHLPYHDERAVQLFFDLAQRFQPDIVVVGSDAFDLPSISRFDVDPDLGVDDWLQTIHEYWTPMISQLRKILPFALLPFIFGNHCRRGLQSVKSSDTPITGMRVFLDTIKAGGAVLYLGKTEVVEIGGLVVAHGNKASKYAAFHVGAQWSHKQVNAGHTHRPQMMQNAVINGMLCQKIPHYADNGYPNEWAHGTTLMTVDTHHGTVAQVPHVFHEKAGALWCAYGDEILVREDAIAAQEGIAA